MNETPSPFVAIAGQENLISEIGRRQAVLKASALQSAILDGTNFSIIATDEKGIIQFFNVGAECMLGYAAAEVVNKINPCDLYDLDDLHRKQ